MIRSFEQVNLLLSFGGALFVLSRACTQLHGTLHPLHSTPARAKLPQPRKHHVRATHAGGGPKSRAPAPNGVPTAFCNFLDFFRHSAPPRTAAPRALFFNNLGMNLSELERPSPSPEKSSLARYRARRQIVLPPRGSPAFFLPFQTKLSGACSQKALSGKRILFL